MTGAPVANIGKPLSLALISNPLAGANRSALAGVKALMARHSDYRHLLARDGAELAEAVAELRHRPPDVLAINGGDGSVARVLTSLFRDSPEPLPLLALVPGGTTNMSANDLGLSGRPDTALARLVHWCQMPDLSRIRRRSILCVQADGGEAIYGLFLGLGLVARAVALSRRKRASARWPGLVPPLLTMAVIGDVLRGRQPLGGPLAVAMEEGRASRRVDVQALFASTLYSLLLGIKPFPRVAPDERFHWGAVAPGFPSPWRTLPRYLTGGTHPLITEANGFYRRRASALTLHYRGDFMVDGELYPLASTLKIGATEPLGFVRV